MRASVLVMGIQYFREFSCVPFGFAPLDLEPKAMESGPEIGYLGTQTQGYKPSGFKLNVLEKSPTQDYFILLF